MKDQRLQSLLIKLRNNPIFKMSLGSKELFHSNFLEFLWDIDNNKFIEMINQLLPEEKRITIKGGLDYYFDREKENFDICLHHTEKRVLKNGKIGKQDVGVYDLIIENKVKSIPRQDQLEEYVKNADGKGNTVFLLLSLATDFPCKKDIGYKWVVANYIELKKAIKDIYKNHKTNNGLYLEDYCKFIEIMHNLQEHMICGFDNQVFYNQPELEEYKQLRIHDLYIKLRGSMFIIRVKEKLEENTNANIHILPFNVEDKKGGKTIKRSFKYDDIRPYCKKNSGIHIFLDCTIQQGNGMIAAFVYKHRDICDYIYEVVIQGDQYRHGINSHNDSDVTLLNGNSSEQEKDDAKKLKNLWRKVNNENSDYFRIIHNTSPTNPEVFNKYVPEYVYKYVNLKDEKVEELIDSFVADIIDNVLPKLK